MVDVQIKGMDELLKSLRILPERIQKNVVRGAIRAAADGIAKDAKNNVPVHFGALKKSIGITQRKSRARSLVGYAVSPRKDILVKELLKQGRIKKWSVSKHTRFKSSNFDNYGGYVEFGNSHQAPQPYLRPAYELKSPEAIRLARDYMEKRIDKEIAKARQ